MCVHVHISRSVVRACVRAYQLLSGVRLFATPGTVVCQVCVCGVWCVCVCVCQSLSGVRLFATPWTVVCQVPLYMESSRQEYWSGLPFPYPGYLPDPGIEPGSPVLAGRFLTT